MDDRTRSVVIAVVAILAVALVAATIESTVVPDASGSGPGIGGPEAGEGVSPPPMPETAPGETVEIPFLSQILSVLAALVLVALLVYAYRYWRTTIAMIVAFGVAIALVVLLVLNVDAVPQPAAPPTMEGNNGSILGGGGGGEAGEVDGPTLPAVVLLLVLGGALFATIVAYVRSSPPAEDSTEEESEPEVDTAAVGNAAGRAADRLEAESDVGNEVYRAWREMTDLLEVPDPETSTPAEFATAAIEAGMRRDDVDELTRLFEDVRYGDQEPSPDREARAVRIFRRIEDHYSDEQGSEAP